MKLSDTFTLQSALIEGEDYGLNEVFEHLEKGMQTFETFAEGLIMGMLLTGSLAVLGMGLLAGLISFFFIIPFKSKAEKKSFWKTQGILMLVFLTISTLIFVIPYAMLFWI
ncbi:hypothetical protein SFC66_12130 [Terribacillus saccharophilus]|uniref:hypothetical protein n=1 Tax=Terribacillus saccharophilus TaxID=361277 RepID=UPI0039829ADF